MKKQIGQVSIENLIIKFREVSGSSVIDKWELYGFEEMKTIV